MNKGKMSTIKEISYGSSDYYLGLNYLDSNHSNNSHLRSCYEGVSFRNLAQCITFEREGRVVNVGKYLRRPQRFIMISTSDEIIGIMVTASMPEFYKEIEYEDYAVIGAVSSLDYDKFLSHISFKNRAEIVTFNSEQAQLVRSKFSVKKTHYWSVFAYREVASAGVFADIRLMGSDDFYLARQLSKGLPEESSPLRLLQFQLNGLPYKNYVLSFNGMDSVFVGFGPYSARVCQLTYLVGLSANDTLLLTAIEEVGKLVQSFGCELIWRLRKKDALKIKTLINQSSLVELAKESHLHLS